MPGDTVLATVTEVKLEEPDKSWKMIFRNDFYPQFIFVYEKTLTSCSDKLCAQIRYAARLYVLSVDE